MNGGWCFLVSCNGACTVGARKEASVSEDLVRSQPTLHKLRMRFKNFGSIFGLVLMVQLVSGEIKVPGPSQTRRRQLDLLGSRSYGGFGQAFRQLDFRFLGVLFENLLGNLSRSFAVRRSAPLAHSAALR